MIRRLLMAGPLALAMTLPALAAPDAVERGRRIYEQGITTEGEPLRAISAGNSRLTGAQAACTACHRRSGMGSREGSVAVSPVTGPILYTRPAAYWPRRPGREAQPVKPLRQDARTAYDDASLVRAIRAGIDPDGRPLDPLMPRYELGDADAQALTAYLRQLAAAPVPGVDAGGLHLATIVTADADPLRAGVVVDTLTAWSRSGALGGIPIDLQVWRLEGPASGWARQLGELYHRHPVYAVISGAGRAQWGPVREFCERSAVPCLFPIVDFAPGGPDDYYSMYLSRGVSIEARILARHLNELEPRPARVVQIVGGEAGAESARLLAAELDELAAETRGWRPDAPASVVDGISAGDVVVGWLEPAQLDAMARARPGGLDAAVTLLSAQLAPPGKTDLPPAWRREARWISVRSDPARVQGRGVLGLTPWLSQLKLTPGEMPLLAEVYAATYFFGDALARMRGHWSREFLLETLETANYGRPAGSAFFALSLAPGQREAARAGHLMGFAGPDLRDLIPFGKRVAP